MQLLDELRREHDLIERVLGSLRTYAALADAPLEDGRAFLAFLETYAHWHHQREEGVLFPALTNEAMLPGDRGPIAVISHEHEDLAKTLGAMRDALRDRAEFARLAAGYSHALWLHIDVENSVLFPESEQQLRRNGVRELPIAEMPEEVREAARVGESLIARHPPSHDPIALRGEGCVVCSAYGDTCRGLEREWWNEWQWEELDEHVAAS
jgi:hemerythrin-like domain-containing protein